MSYQVALHHEGGRSDLGVIQEENLREFTETMQAGIRLAGGGMLSIVPVQSEASNDGEIE